ncbi:MAG: proline iminopeptidase [Planctomycetota bacterium]|jgi:proline iminopeptidase
MPNEHFLEPREPFATGMLAVDDLHTIYFERSGNPDGPPVLFIHGGPGAGCSPTDRCFFDAEALQVILFDQRGCGRSEPLGEIRENTVEHLVRDIEQLREELGIDKWHVFGGSWGSTLGLYYAQAHPERVLSLVLRGIWLLTPDELHWWLYGIRWIQPELWREFAEHLPQDERDDLLEGYWRRLTGEDRAVALEAARHWSIYEGSCCTLLPNPEYTDAFAGDDLAWNLARLEAHYFRAGIEPQKSILDRIECIRHIPAFAVHGRYDIVCPVRSLHDLSCAWPELDAQIVPDAGHSSHEPGITRELVAAMDRIARTGSPQRN